jgi:solute carrier family 15 (oligopeptide transporter), member 1
MSSEAAPKQGHLPALWYIFGGEFAERCSYYGMRALLPLYLTSTLLYTDTEMSAFYPYFKAACYLLPIVGGIIADRFLGRYWALAIFLVPYLIGQFMLTVPDRNYMLISLVLLACGSGIIKPNISSLLGMTYDQKRPGQTTLRAQAFNIFYLSINLGAFLSMLFLPMIRNSVRDAELAKHQIVFKTLKVKDEVLKEGWFGKWNEVVDKERDGYILSGKEDLNVSDTRVLDANKKAYGVAFQVPAWLMLGAMILFIIGKKHYAVETVQHKEATPEEKQERWKTLSILAGVFGMIIFFWIAYEQNDNQWTLFIRDHVDRTLNMGFWKHEFAADGFQFFNSLFIVILLPIYTLMWAKIDPDGKRYTRSFKITVGFVITGMAAGTMALAASLVGAEKVNAWWIVLAYFVLTIGEIMVYGTGLELSYAIAPPNMKSFITSCFLLTNTCGNLILAQFAWVYTQKPIPNWAFYLITFVILCIVALVFRQIGKSLEKQIEAQNKV